MLTISTVPTALARTGHIMPGFKNNLISISQLCNPNCTAYFDKNHIMVRDKHSKPVLHGTREHTGARLWRVNINPAATQPSALLIHCIPNEVKQSQDVTSALSAPMKGTPAPHIIPDDMPDTSTTAEHTRTATAPPSTTTTTVPPTPTAPAHKTMSYARAYDLQPVPALIAFLHATAGYPVKQTWVEAIKRGAYHSWPGLTPQLMARYGPNADETHLGHMAQPRQHTQSTQRCLARDMDATAQTANTVKVIKLPLNRMFTNNTGHFQLRARSGNQYLMVAFHAKSNAILIQPFATKHDGHRIPAYNTLYTQLPANNNQPEFHIMDNEASAAFKNAITANGCKLQLVPPHVHRHNAAKRAIRTFKDHFLACLAGVDPSYPANRWDLILPQIKLTLNLLQPTAIRNAQLAWEALFGHYNFDATPMGPAGSQVLIHNKLTA